MSYFAIFFRAMAVLAGFCSVSAFAAENVTYAYDALGRLVRVEHAGGPTNGVVSAYQYDPAGNRSLVEITGAVSSSPPANVVIVPLNGLTVLAL